MMNPLEVKKLKEWAPLPLVITVIMFLAPGFIISPRLENLGTIESSFDVTLKSAQELLVQRNADLLLNQKQARLDQQIKRIDRWLPPEEELPNCIDQFNTLAKTFSAQIVSTYYRFPRNPREFMPPRVIISFNLECEYLAMRQFLQALEYFPLPLVPVEVVANNNRTFTIEMIHLVRP